MVRRTTHWLIAMAMLVAPCLALPLVPARDVDANGDRAVDVLDVQLVISQVLHGDSPHANADVNADGRVDILDFQRILQEAQETQAEEPIEDSTPNDAVIVRAPDAPVTHRLQIPTSLEPSEEKSSATQRPLYDDRRCRTPRTERYTFHLTSNAPPRA